MNYLVIPGLGNSSEKHWQTLWEKENPINFKRVLQDNWDMPECENWVSKLQEYISTLKTPTILVAHSLGCLTVAHWARKFSSSFIIGALLVAPADAETSKRLNFVKGFAPIPRAKLPFKSVVVASSNDQYALLETAENFAHYWGSDFINIGEKGHINASSGIENWQEGKEILENLTKIIEEKIVTLQDFSSNTKNRYA